MPLIGRIFVWLQTMVCQIRDLNIGFPGCLADRTPTDVTIDSIDPVVTCPADLTVTVDVGELFTIPDYTGGVSATDKCTASPVISQDPVVGTMVGVGVTVITMTATDEVGNDATCTFDLTVEELLGLGDLDFDTSIVFYPNPTSSNITLVNNSSLELKSATITDVNGRIVQNIDMQNEGSETVFSVESLSQGMYFVKIEAESTSVIKRIVKQ